MNGFVTCQWNLIWSRSLISDNQHSVNCHSHIRFLYVNHQDLAIKPIHFQVTAHTFQVTFYNLADISVWLIPNHSKFSPIEVHSSCVVSVLDAFISVTIPARIPCGICLASQWAGRSILQWEQHRTHQSTVNTSEFAVTCIQLSVASI